MNGKPAEIFDQITDDIRAAFQSQSSAEESAPAVEIGATRESGDGRTLTTRIHVPGSEHVNGRGETGRRVLEITTSNYAPGKRNTSRVGRAVIAGGILTEAFSHGEVRPLAPRTEPAARFSRKALAEQHARYVATATEPGTLAELLKWAGEARA